VIDTATNKVVGPPIKLGTGTGPLAVAVTPDGTHAYVANSGTGTVSVIDTATNNVLTGPGFPIPVGTGPDGVAVTPDGTQVYVTNAGAGTVSVIATNHPPTVPPKVVATIPVSARSVPGAVAIAPDGAHVYVTTLGTSTSGFNTVTLDGVGALKADPTLASIPVIMATFVDDKNMGFALGATDFLTKPIDRKYLAQLLKKYRCANPPCPVLVVEDQADLRELMRRMLEQEGWVVAEAETGRVALDRVAENRPELIVLDLMMPEMDGFSFIEALRQNLAWRSIPIVVVTAKDLTEEDRLRLNGYVQYIVDKGSHNQEDLLREVADRIASCLAEVA
jgi:YVTN family beta-propeller protein